MPNELNEVRKMEVTRAGYKYIGHYRSGYLEIILEGSCLGVAVHPRDTFAMLDLFKVFGIDAEDGVWFEKLVGRCCRVHFKKGGYVKSLQHITNENIVWNAEESNR